MFKVSELLNATQGKLVCGAANATVKGVSIDSRALKKGEAFVAIKGDNFNGHNYINAAIKKGATCVISQKETSIKPGIVFIKVKDTIRALGDIARFNRERFDIPVIAVTGSNGKTTAKEMIAWVLSRKFKVLKNEGTKNNHIGLPLTLLKLDSSYDLAVLEIGTNHFGEVEYLADIARANVGVITNIGHSHLAYFKNLRGVFKEKYSLIKSLKEPAVAILNTDDLYLKKQVCAKEKSPFVLGVGINNRCDFNASSIKMAGGKANFTVNGRFRFALNVLGYYNIHNSLLAIAAGRIFGLGYNDIARRLSVFNLPRGRLNFIEKNKVRFIDDTYNANPLSLGQALGTLKNFPCRGKRICVMGDMLELGRSSLFLHKQAIDEALKSCDILITVGKLTKTALGKVAAGKKNIFSCKTSPEAREILFKRIGVCPSDIVLVKGSRGMKMEEVLNF